MKTGLLNKTALCAAGIAVGMAAPVWADPEQDTIIFGGSGAGTIPYAGFGEPVTLEVGTLGVDIVDIFTQSQGMDGLEDLRFVTGLGLSEEAFGRIELAAPGLLGELPPAPIEADVAAFEDVPHFGGFGGSINQRGRFAADELGAPRFFETGDTVGADDFPGLIWPVDVATDRFIDGLEAGPLDAIDLFGAEGGALPNQGDTGIFGFVIEFYQSSPLYEFPINQVAAFQEENGPPDLCLIPIDLEQFEPGNGYGNEFCDIQPEILLASYYGWVQVSHGSVVPGLIGINPFGQGALVSIPGTPPVVPLPAAGWMLLAGIGGLVAMRRRAKVS